MSLFYFRFMDKTFRLYNMHRRQIFFFLILSSVFYACISPNQTYSKIPPGTWRGVLFLDGEIPTAGSKKEVIVGNQYIGELPFSFEIGYTENEDLFMIIKNGEEKIKIEGLQFGRDKATAKDTLIIPFLEYDTYIKAIVEEGVMEGYWHVNYKKDYKIRFKANHGDGDRFKNSSPAKVEDFSGRYQVQFSPGTPDAYPGVGIFSQNGLMVQGTFTTETGDYRFLEGKAIGDKVLLSCFDGAHAYLFEMKKKGKDLIGEFRSGTHHREAFEGTLNPNASLRSGFELIGSKNNSPFFVQFPDANGQLVDTRTEEFKNKVKIYEIMGTWCPNCKDASLFLSALHKKNPDVKVIPLAFERYRDSLTVRQKIKNYENKLKLPYKTLLAGYYNKKEASAVLPQLDSVLAYPTMVITDKKDVIRKVFTGFYGPATPEYAILTKEIEKIVRDLQNE